MPKPRRARTGPEPAYQGRYSRTHTREHEVVDPDEGTPFVAELCRAINRDDDPALFEQLLDGTLHRVDAPSGASVRADQPVTVFSPSERRFFLVIPSDREQDELALRIELLQDLAAEDEPVPTFMLDVEVVHAPATASDFRPPVDPETENLARLTETRQREEQRLEDIRTELAAAEQRLAQTQRLMVGEDEPTAPDLMAMGRARHGRKAIEEAETQVHIKSPYVVADDDLEIITSAELQLLEEGGDRVQFYQLPATAELRRRAEPKGPTDLSAGGTQQRAPSTAEVTGTGNGDARLLRVAPDLSSLAIGGGMIAVVGDRVQLHYRVAKDRIGAFTEVAPEVYLQLHRMAPYPVVALLVVARDQTGRLVDDLAFAFDVMDEADRRVLQLLRERYRLEVHLYDEGGRRTQYQRFEAPLEGNVEYVLETASELLALTHQRHRDLPAALALFRSEGYERLGARRHNFHADSFSRIGSPGAAKLAVNIVGYWSEEQNFRYLIEQCSFPIVTFRAIQQRVAAAATRFGIFLPDALRPVAIGCGLAENQEELMALLVERFAEVTANMPSDTAVTDSVSDLDWMARSENWDQLLTTCLDLGVPVDDRVSELADIARRRAHRAAPRGGHDNEETHEYRRISSFEQVSNEDLRFLLQKGGMAPAVSRELLERGGETNILCVIEAARVLDEDGLRQTARVLAAGAESFEPALLIGLGRVHARTVQLCALALAMSRRTEALPTLIELLHRPDRVGDLPMAEIIAEFGADALDDVFAAIDVRGPTEPLIEVLARISIDSGAKIIDYLREHPVPAYLDAAQKMSDVRRRLASRKTRTLDDGGGEIDGNDLGEKSPGEDS